MSQFFVGVSSGNIPPSVATSYVTDIGTAIPAANILNVIATDTSADNDNGIRTIASPNLSNNLIIQLTNRVTGSVTTTNNTPTVVVSVSLGTTPGVYIVQGSLVAFDVTDSAGGGYTYDGAAITNGVTGIEIDSEIRNIFEQAALATSDFSFTVSGNNAVVTVIGIAGKTINWSCLFTYRFVG